MVGDELLALDGQRVRQPAQWSAALRAGVAQSLLISRRSQLHTLTLQPLQPTVERYRLVRSETASVEQRQAQERWLTLAAPLPC
jgi:predicted metalloprotease with PDZ domain